jgi:outer membrane protein W
VVITVLVLALMGFGLQRPAAADFGATSTTIGVWSGIVLGVATLSYLAYVNRPANQPVDWSPRGPGGWYVGLYSGVSFVPSTDWHYKTPDRSYNAQTPYPTTAESIGFNASPVVGLKVGYYFHKVPNFGLEGDFFYSRPSLHEQTVTLTTPFPPNNKVPGNQALFPRQTLAQWTWALHIMGRLGFLKDDEVPFGRLQPYVGIGPGFTVLFGDVDAAKNFGVDGMIGVRYMLRKNLSIFTEFKVNHQFAVELEHQKLKQLNGGFEQRALASFDFTMETLAVGMCVHFW